MKQPLHTILTALTVILVALAPLQLSAAKPQGSKAKTESVDSADRPNHRIERIRQSAAKAVDDARRSLGKEIRVINPDSLSETVVLEIDRDDAEHEITDQVDRTVSYESDFDSFLSKSLIIPLCRIVFGVTIPFTALVLIIYFICQSAVKRRQIRYEAIVRAAEAGHPLPPQFYESEMQAGKSRLQSGIVWIGWGVAISLFGFFVDAEGIFAMGIIPLFIGLSRLAVFFYDKKKKEKSRNNRCDNSTPDSIG